MSLKKTMIILATSWLQQTKTVETIKIKKQVPHLQEYSHEKLHSWNCLRSNLFHAIKQLRVL